MNSRWQLALLLVALAPMALGDRQLWINPKPAADDVELPMPGGAAMVFRKVAVPGESFWADPRRVVQIGDAQGGVFEGLQRIQVSGSFFDAAQKRWHYYLGKYEVTRGQYAALMGAQALQATLTAREQADITTATGVDRDKRLAIPISGLSWLEVQTFIHKFNQWLFDAAAPQRQAKLPRRDGTPGFLRLAGEVEWEFAARGGMPARAAGSFSSALPFEPQDLERHAWYLDNAKHSLRRIGLRRPGELGLHDLFGNAQELVLEPFRPEIWQGMAGALSARGGSVATARENLRASSRAEVEIFYWDADAKAMRERRSYTTGLRLAIGANVVVGPQSRANLERSYHNYLTNLRAAMPVGKTLDNPVASAAEGLGAAQRLLGDLGADPGAGDARLDEVRATLAKAQQQLDHGLRQAALSAALDASRRATDLGRDVFKLAQLEGHALAKARKLAKVDKKYTDLLKRIQAQLNARRESIAETLQRYADEVTRLGEHSGAHINGAFVEIEGRNLSVRAKAAVELLKTHVADYRRLRRVPTASWHSDFKGRFRDLAD